MGFMKSNHRHLMSMSPTDGDYTRACFHGGGREFILEDESWLFCHKKSKVRAVIRDLLTRCWHSGYTGWAEGTSIIVSASDRGKKI